MFWLGLILPLCYVAGVTGATIPTQWAVLSVGLLPALWVERSLAPVHWLGLGFLAFVVASLAWTLDISTGVWIACIWGLAFWYGSTAGDLLPLWRGLAVGLSVNSAIAVAQYFGIDVVPAQGPGGLLFNPAVLGACLALVLVAMIGRGQWWYIPALVSGMMASNSRGAWLALGVTLVAKYVHWSAAAGIVAAGAAAIVLHPGQSDLMRVHLWSVALQNLTWFGNGVGSFNVVHVFYQDHSAVLRAENVHNDAIQLIFEFGMVGLVPIGIMLAALRRTDATDWPVLLAFAVLGLVYFPLWSPIPAFIGCVVAGHILRGHDPVRGRVGGWGSDIVPRSADEEFGPGLAGVRNIPSFERFTEPHEISDVRHQRNAS